MGAMFYSNFYPKRRKAVLTRFFHLRLAADSPIVILVLHLLCVSMSLSFLICKVDTIA